MDELQGAAKAYYKNMSPHQQASVSKFFKDMDTNSDGKVTWKTFRTYLRQKGYFIGRNLDNKVDQNYDGCLNFYAFLTVCYIILIRSVVCNHCKEHILGLYFACVECYNRADNTYYLCITCYSNKKFSRHNHAHFLDNHMLLMRKRRKAPASGNPNQAIVPARSQRPATTAPLEKVCRVLEALAGILGIANAVNLCAIM